MVLQDALQFLFRPQDAAAGTSSWTTPASSAPEKVAQKRREINQWLTEYQRQVTIFFAQRVSVCALDSIHLVHQARGMDCRRRAFAEPKRADGVQAIRRPDAKDQGTGRLFLSTYRV